MNDIIITLLRYEAFLDAKKSKIKGESVIIAKGEISVNWTDTKDIPKNIQDLKNKDVSLLLVKNPEDISFPFSHEVVAKIKGAKVDYVKFFHWYFSAKRYFKKLVDKYSLEYLEIPYSEKFL